MAAGRRFGKTELSLTILITEAIQTKGRYWYIAPTYRQAEMIAWKRLQNMLPPQVIKKKNEVKLEIELFNGSEIALKGADNEDSLKGVGLHRAILDEYAFMKANVWQEIVRPMLTDVQGKALFIGTPKGKNHFYELFNLGLNQLDGFNSYRFKTLDNPYIKKEEIDSAKKQLADRYFKQEYEASFEDFTGLIWTEFNKSHIVEPFFIPDYYERIAAIDPAMTGTTAVLFSAIDEDGNLIIYDEYYEQDKRVSEVSQAIKGKASVYYCDPAGNRKAISRNGTLFSFFDEFNDNGIFPVNAQNEVNAGINRVAEYFKANRIKIFSNCKNLIQELERYHWAEERETMLGIAEPKPFKSFDHACDCLRYLVMSRSKTEAQKKPMTYEESTQIMIEPFKDFVEAPTLDDAGGVFD